MNLLEPMSSPAILAALSLLLMLFALRMRQRGTPARRGAAARDGLDTVQDWPPTASRVLSIHERQAYELLRRALPGFMVLAQVPLARFLRVPTRHSYTDWLQRAGSLSADLLLCDAGSRVLAVIDIRPPHETERARRRHDRLSRVLKAAGIRVHVWREGELPTLAQVRQALGGELAAPSAKPTASRPMPLIPVADISEILAEGDEAFCDAANEPVPSSFFEDIDAAGAAR